MGAFKAMHIPGTPAHAFKAGILSGVGIRPLAVHLPRIRGRRGLS